MAETITSTHNPRIRELRKLRERKGREASGSFIAEGEDMLEAALRAGAVPQSVFSVPDPPPALEELLSQLPAGTERLTATADALAAAGSLGSGSRVIGVWKQDTLRSSLPEPARRLGDDLPEPARRLGDDLPEPARRLGDERPFLYLYDVADPGNVGTVLRSAQAFGAGGVLLSPRTADPFGPKAVRASMGAVFGLPPARAGFEAASADRVSVALVPGAGRPLREVPLDGSMLFVLGAERAGLPPDVVAACAEVAHVPVDRGAADSLNVAMAATLCLYEYRARHA